jgi:hypothetical protein
MTTNESGSMSSCNVVMVSCGPNPCKIGIVCIFKICQCLVSRINVSSVKNQLVGEEFLVLEEAIQKLSDY